MSELRLVETISLARLKCASVRAEGSASASSQVVTRESSCHSPRWPSLQESAELMPRTRGPVPRFPESKAPARRWYGDEIADGAVRQLDKEAAAWASLPLGSATRQ